jgi:peroxiredoxin
LAELRSLLKPNEAVKLYAISTDSLVENKKLAETIAADGKGAIAFGVLSDPGSRVVDTYRLRDPFYQKLAGRGIAYPAVYVIDKTGRVAWAQLDKSYTNRPTNKEIRAALDALK